MVLRTLYSTPHPHIYWLQSSSEACREGVGRTAGSCRPEDAWEGPCSYKEKTRPLGGIQGADHLQLRLPARGSPECQAGGPASTSSLGRNSCLLVFPLEVAEVAPRPHPGVAQLEPYLAGAPLPPGTGGL